MKFTLLIGIVLAANACGNNEKVAPENFPTQKEVNRSMQEVNRKFMADESAMIDAYIERRNWNMSQSGTGLRYMIYDDNDGDNAKNGQRATVAYKIELLDGKEIYNSEDLGNKEFLIGQAHVESGLHEGVLLMSVGDKAKFILPSHLAHGLSGDQDQIPPRSSVVYDIELIALN